MLSNLESFSEIANSNVYLANNFPDFFFLNSDLFIELIAEVSMWLTRISLVYLSGH